MNANFSIRHLFQRPQKGRAVVAGFLLAALTLALPAGAFASSTKQAQSRKTTRSQNQEAANGTLLVTVFDGTREPLPNGTVVFMRLFDGNQKQIASGFYKGPSIKFVGLPIHDNFVDTLRVVATTKSYNTEGVAAVTVHAGSLATAEIMLLPKHSQFVFEDWSSLRRNYPWLAELLAHGAGSEAAARARYRQLMAEDPGALAALLNITTAGRQVKVDQGLFINYFKEVVWDEQRPEWREHHMVGFNPADDSEHTMRHDRFWAYADKRLGEQIRQGVKEGRFFVEHGSQVFHPGATGSFKENTMEEGHIHVSLYENDTRVIDGVDCFLLEIHLDLYKDLLAHGILEVIPNTLLNELTEPEDAYQLRWIASINSGQGEFAPPLAIVPFDGRRWHKHVSRLKKQ